MDEVPQPAATPPIAFVTIGQAPRPDVVPELVANLDLAPECHEFGALDGLDAHAIARHAPRAREPSLYTRLIDGSHVVVGAAFIEDRLQQLVARLDHGGYDLIVVISTGIYRRLAAATPLVHGQRLGRRDAAGCQAGRDLRPDRHAAHALCRRLVATAIDLLPA
jgi:hypothetical protein